MRLVPARYANCWYAWALAKQTKIHQEIRMNKIHRPDLEMNLGRAAVQVIHVFFTAQDTIAVQLACSPQIVLVQISVHSACCIYLMQFQKVA